MTSIALALLTGCVSAATYTAACDAPMQNWSSVRVVPDSTLERPINFVFVDAQNQLHWNGRPVTEDLVRKYLGVITQFSSKNLTVLSSHPSADCAAVTRMRQMFNEVLGCGPASCAEVVG